MPYRPPREWFARCTSDVAAGSSALDPAAVCGATWARKTPAKKAQTVALEEGRHSVKKKPHGAALKAHKRAMRAKKSHHGRARHARGHHGRVHGRTSVSRAGAHAKGHRVHHRCGYCGHTARHDRKHGCLHVEHSGRFCPCRHKG
jgi:hypothetical protein